jgi:hypothetical protein
MCSVREMSQRANAPEGTALILTALQCTRAHVISWAGNGDMHCGYTTWGHAQCGRVWHHLCLCVSRALQHSMAGGQVGIPAGGGQAGIPAGATLRMGMHSHAMGEGGH